MSDNNQNKKQDDKITEKNDENKHEGQHAISDNIDSLNLKKALAFLMNKECKLNLLYK